MEGMFKGAGWLSLIALAAGASLTFVPDKTWESFPEPLAPVRARLASVGIAPEKYRPKETKEEFKLAEPASKDQFESPFEQDKNTASDPGQRSRVRIHGDDRDFPSDDRALSSPVRDRFADPALDAPQSPENPTAAPSTPPEDPFNDPIFDSAPDAATRSELVAPIDAAPDVSSSPATTPTPENTFSPFSDADALLGESSVPPANSAVGAPPIAAPTQAPNAMTAPSQFTTDSVTAFPTIPTTPAPEQNAAPVASYPDASAATIPATSPPTALGVESMQPAPVAQTPGVPAPNAIPESSVGVQNVIETQQQPQSQAVFVDPQTAAPLAQNQPPTVLQGVPATNQALVPTTNAVQNFPEPAQLSAADCGVGVSCSTLLAQGNVAGSLEAALRPAQNLQSADHVVEVFVTLDRLRPYYFRSDQAETLARINKALDSLSYDVLYNREVGILEPLYQTKPGDTVALIAQEWDVTPETVKAINCLEAPDDSPLPPGTTLKVVRGPVTAEISTSRKELLLRFNNLYAGRFPCGVPQQAAGLRGEYVVERKIQNPSCKAIDMQGAELVIEGGDKDNPLGACWIGLNGGYGFQGTNRPELVGTDVLERSGFVFSNLHISQLDIVTAVGTTVRFTD